MTEPRCIVEARASLGESPVWDAASGALYWVDINAGSVHRLGADGEQRAWPLGESVGSIGLREGGGLVVATRTGLHLLDTETGDRVALADPIAGRADLRFNDGRVDRRGRFWAGTVHEKRVRGAGALYRLDPDRTVRAALDGVTVANGIAWSPDDRIMYFADSHERRIDAFDFEADAGTISGRRAFAAFRPEWGVPDGATVDGEGGLWIAGIGGGRVFRFAPDGRLDRTVALPVSQPTSCSFGGPGTATLFVTTGRRGLTDAALRAEPLAGGIFAFEPGVAGLPEPQYRG